MKHYQIAIVGGGASGLVLALLLKRKGITNIVILDKNDRLGRKLSATGNGQGNLTNLNMGGEHYFSSDPALVSSIIEEFSVADTVDLFGSIGGLLLPDERGRVYPASKQGSSATDLLRFALKDTATELQTSVTKISYQNGFVLETTGEKISADQVVLATGGKAAKQFGTDGTSYALATAFGHSVTKLYPSLVQFKADMSEYKSLKGIRVDAVISDGEHKMRGDVIFTEYGLSGDAVFRLSPFVVDKKNVTVSLELLPDVSESTLLEILKNKNVPKEELFCGVLTNQIGRLLLKKTNSLKEAVHLLKTWKFPLTGTLDFNYAQVTKGGIPLNEVTRNLESKKRKGLFFTGEILDVDGECGGYNLQWAFASANRVAEELCRR